MANWDEILFEISEYEKSDVNRFDMVRRKYLKKLFEYTKRNVIIYYSGWLQKGHMKEIEVNDNDKNGFMTVIHNLDHSIGLDLILHTPGGGAAATESIVDYLHSIFGNNIRAFIPQLAMSAGTMIACSCKEIFMGMHSSLGPIDPQIDGMPAHGILEEFKKAYEQIKDDNDKLYVWQPIISKYNPTLIGECEKAIAWSKEIVEKWLVNCMFKDEQDKENKAKKIVVELSDHSKTKSHSRHLSSSFCRDKLGLKIEPLEKDKYLQDLVLSVHYACIHTLSTTGAIKIIENHNGKAFIHMMKPKK